MDSNKFKIKIPLSLDVKIVLTLLLFLVLNQNYMVANSHKVLTINPSLKNKSIYIITNDISNFWKAFDTIQKVTEITQKKELLNSIYFQNCSFELNEIYKKNNQTPESCLNTIEKYKSYYLSIKKNTTTLFQKQFKLEAIYHKLKKIYPTAKTRKVNLTMSFLTFGGLTTDSTIFIGADLVALDSNAETSQIPLPIKNDFNKSNNFVQIFAHELIHVQQKNVKPIKLLSYSIAEGSCDFIAQILVGPTYQTPYLTYGFSHEKLLFLRFQKDLAKNEIRNWLHNYSSQQSQTSDLGYFMGYAITKSFYEQNQKKTKEKLKDIIELDYSNYNAVVWFYAQSKYQEKFTN